MLPFSANIEDFYNSNRSSAANDLGLIQTNGYVCSWRDLEPVTLEKAQNEVHIINLSMNTCFWKANDKELIDNQENIVMIQKQTEASFGLSN